MTRIWPWVRNSLAVALCAWLAWGLFHREFWSAWRDLHGTWMLLALGTTLATLFVRVMKWHLLLSEEKLPRNGRESARALLGGYALASITPGRVGDLSRCMFMREGRRGRTLLFTFVDKMFDVWAVLGFAVLSLFLFLPRVYALAAAAGWVALVPLFICSGRWVRHASHHSSHLERFRSFWEAFTSVSAGCFGGWALCSSALDMVTLFCLLRAFHDTGFKVALVSYPWMVIAGALPLSLGGVGPREGLSALLLPFFSISRVAAVNI
ncbi:MAG: lysylphosphatidylglycerol synthase transmembrane domain-containing protein, partial [Terriglobia bacterium]